MPRPASQSKYRLDRGIADWTVATALVRQAAAEEHYSGPTLAQMEEIGQGIAQVRAAIGDWIFAVAAREARGSARRRSGQVRAAIRGLSAPD